MKQTSPKENGYTIIELIIAVTLFSMLMLLAVSVLTTIFTGSNQQVIALSNVDQARLVTSQFTNEMRNANTGVDGSFALNTTNDNQIIFYARAASPGTTVNRIRYYITGKTLYKGVIIPTGNPLAYVPANESIKVVQNNLVTTGAPLFTYYDGNYDGSTNPLSQPINVNSVKFIKMNITALTNVKQNATTSFSISSGAVIRNLKNNLGN